MTISVLGNSGSTLLFDIDCKVSSRIDRFTEVETDATFQPDINLYSLHQIEFSKCILNHQFLRRLVEL